jgi:hypothetical protein
MKPRKIPHPTRARGGNRGGCGGGYENTDPDYTDKRLAALRREYRTCPDQWKDCFLTGLSKFEQDYLTKRKRELPKTL